MTSHLVVHATQKLLILSTSEAKSFRAAHRFVDQHIRVGNISHGSISESIQFNNFISLQPDKAELGAPVFTDRKMDAAVASRCVELNMVISHLPLLSAHDALILFTASFNRQKMVHMLR